MNEQEMQALAREWHERFENTRQAMARAKLSGELGPIGQMFVTCWTFAFYSGVEAAIKLGDPAAQNEDVMAFLALTSQEITGALMAAGIDLVALDQIRGALQREPGSDN